VKNAGQGEKDGSGVLLADKCESWRLWGVREPGEESKKSKLATPRYRKEVEIALPAIGSKELGAKRGGNFN